MHHNLQRLGSTTGVASSKKGSLGRLLGRSPRRADATQGGPRGRTALRKKQEGILPLDAACKL